MSVKKTGVVRHAYHTVQLRVGGTAGAIFWLRMLQQGNSYGAVPRERHVHSRNPVCQLTCQRWGR
jgi:hypothetical protein